MTIKARIFRFHVGRLFVEVASYELTMAMVSVRPSPAPTIATAKQIGFGR